MKTIILTVTNDLTYDQRMIRICTSLADNGFRVILTGRKLRNSVPLSARPFEQVRLFCFFQEGKKFYAEYNTRLFFFLLKQRVDCICAIDLDTILPCYLASVLKRIPRVYDAHELFCEMKEIVTRPSIYKTWKLIEKWLVPKFKNGYTVNQPIAEEFRKMYGVEYIVVRNIPPFIADSLPAEPGDFLLYQGSVNEGRSFESLIPAMKQVNSTLVICGDGNFMTQCRFLVEKHGLHEKVLFKGKLTPDELKSFTKKARAGITLFDNKGLSNYLSLANRFFDYIHAGIPQLGVNYPAYREINNLYEVAVLIDDLTPESIAYECNRLLYDKNLYDSLRQNCITARKLFTWQNEEKTLVAFYKSRLS
jgi:glycosyltransferase involved in cell wall biosynthesis